MTDHVEGAWGSNLQSEVGFWRTWMTDERHREGREARIAGTKIFAQYYLDLIGAPAESFVRVLDVGSGPISTLGTPARRNPIELVCTDALADEYNSLIRESAYSFLPEIKRVKGEDLLAAFGPQSFDIVHCANALDHFEDPARSFENMLAVCKPRGAVVIISVENEGERENYQGLHQWNLRATDDGLFLESRTSSENLLRRAPGSSFAWHYLPSPSDFRIFRATLIRGDA